MINVGTYLRTRGIDHLVDQFLEAAEEDGGQIVSLGAGSDSRFWQLRVSTSIKLSVAVDCKRMMKGAEGIWRAKENPLSKEKEVCSVRSGGNREGRMCTSHPPRPASHMPASEALS